MKDFVLFNVLYYKQYFVLSFFLLVGFGKRFLQCAIHKIDPLHLRSSLFPPFRGKIDIKKVKIKYKIINNGGTHLMVDPYIFFVTIFLQNGRN
jgi:hypothetical protein